MNRWLALLLATVGGAACAFAILIGVGGALFGFLWIFVFGDDPWPGWVETSLNLAIPIFGLAVWAACSWAIWTQSQSKR